MSKRAKRWPIWKIAVTTVGCALLSAVFFWLSPVANEAVGDHSPDPYSRAPVLTLATLSTMLAVMAAMLTLLGIIWLVARIRDSRIPAWKKRDKKRRF